jgi:hypothetical protein
MAQATLIHRSKLIYPDAFIREMIIWRLPEKTRERPHGLKYRLYYGNAEGKCLVRYDNETGKGDHKHINGHEKPYYFTNVENLIRDFQNDINIFRRPK